MPTANVPKPPAPDAIRSWRRERDLSAASAAALVYTTARSWLRWEAGASPMPPALWELARLKRAPARREDEIALARRLPVATAHAPDRSPAGAAGRGSDRGATSRRRSPAAGSRSTSRTRSPSGRQT